jgi:hypothetical protein
MKWRMTFALLLSALLFVGIAQAQYPWSPKDSTPCNHGPDLWDSVKVRPVQFTEFDGDTAYWKYQDNATLKSGSYVFTDQSKFYSVKDTEVNQLYLIAKKNHKWLTFYCDHCKAILRAYELKPAN